jgi:predicted XRE-type DNA-binding protein
MPNALKKAVTRRVRMAKSSGNVFADLGLPHPEQELLKAKLTLQIYRLIKRRGITQTAAGKVLGIKQPHVSALMRNRAGAFSVERLMDFLTAPRARCRDHRPAHAQAARRSFCGGMRQQKSKG